MIPLDQMALATWHKHILKSSGFLCFGVWLVVLCGPRWERTSSTAPRLLPTSSPSYPCSPSIRLTSSVLPAKVNESLVKPQSSRVKVRALRTAEQKSSPATLKSGAECLEARLLLLPRKHLPLLGEARSDSKITPKKNISITSTLRPQLGPPVTGSRVLA